MLEVATNAICNCAFLATELQHSYILYVVYTYWYIPTLGTIHRH